MHIRWVGWITSQGRVGVYLGGMWRLCWEMGGGFHFDLIFGMERMCCARDFHIFIV